MRPPATLSHRRPAGASHGAARTALVGAVLSVGIGLALSSPLAAVDGEALPERFQRWLEEVELLITDAERQAFLALEQSYQRDHFVRRFWKSRDPFPQTPVNEFRHIWDARVEAARATYDGDLTAPGARMVLRLGEPSRRERLMCSELAQPLEAWIYEAGNEFIAGAFTVVFVGVHRPGSSRQRPWRPIDGLRGLVSPTRGGLTHDERTLARLLRAECGRGDDILAALAQSLDPHTLDKALPIAPSDEWVTSFKARSTDLPEGAEPLPGELHLDFPGRHQSRTVVQGVVSIPRLAAKTAREAGTSESELYNLLVDGEILRQGELFDTFRYRFDFPAERVDDVLPLVVQRYLRPGEYELIVKVSDLHSQRVFRESRPLQVPIFDPSRAAGPAGPPDAPAEVDAPPPLPSFGTRLAEANASISTGDHEIRILELPERLMVGKLRITAQVRGEGVDRVGFELNGAMQMRKARPPYSVELDLGPQPRLHTVRAVAFDAEGRELAADEVEVNAGPQRFALRLVSPQPGKTYTESVRAHAEVDVPETERLDRVEIYLNETLLTTLYQAPFEQPILLHASDEVAYVRAVAYLANGSSAEDAVFINAPDFVADYDVHFVELYTTVVDRKGDFVEDLELAELTVREDGTAQEIRRFEKVRDLPIRAGLVIDTSTSMAPVLRDVEKAAHQFLSNVMTPRDRAALITFNDAPTLEVRFTADPEILAGGLVGLVSEGETALYDTLIFALHYLTGGRGKRALIVLTDGEDSSSSYGFEDVLTFARHTGVSIYVVGLGLSSEPTARSFMQQLARETGGTTFFIDGVGQLGKVYDDIQQELRSQYLIGYQSSTEQNDDAFRRVEVEVARKGVKAKTIRGYFPN